MTIILDTNVLIAAFISPQGICHEVFEMSIYNHTLFTSNFILGELRNKLKIKFNYSEKEVEEVRNI